MARKSREAGLTVVAITDDRIAAPGHLTQAQKAEWRAIVDSLPADYFRPGDVPLLSAFCVASALHKEAQSHMEANGMILTDERGKMTANPASSILMMQASSMAQLAMKLRLCPSARMRAEKTASAGVKASNRPWASAV